jgi:hypothetical protein
MLKLVSRVAALALIIGLSAPAIAAPNPTGEALGVDPDARSETKSATKTLVVGDDVFIGDRIVTDTAGLVQILFSDNTKLVVGPNSALVIEDYLLRDNGGKGKLAINALSGTFRFITGRAAKDRYSIETPTGTIGVRGTAVDIFVSKIKTFVLQLHGSTEDCPKETPDDCAILEAVCQLGILDDSQFEVIKHTDELTGDEREAAKEMFRLAFDQGQLLRPFRVPGAERCLKRSSSGGEGGGSMSEPQDGEGGKPGRVIKSPGFSNTP